MLKSLSVKDFAIIEDLTITFDEGMTVLTGETGAGKSLIIDTISLLLGARADSDMIRYGKTSASIIGIFTHTNELNSIFEALGIPILSEIKIERNISDTSKNLIRINGVLVTLAILKNVSSVLADIHVQNDTYKLFNPEGYLPMLDSLADDKYTKLLSKYSKCLFEYLDSYKEYMIVVKGQREALEKLEFYKYEKEELEALDLYEGLDKELEDKISKLSNFDKISNTLNETYSYVSSDALDSLYEAAKALERIGEYDEEYNAYSSKLLDCYYIADEIKGNIHKAIDGLDYDEEELNVSIERMTAISKAKDKYKKTVEELISYLKEITLAIDMAENYDETLNEHKKMVINQFEKVKSAAIDLSTYRRKLSKNLASGIVNECKDLDLPNTLFEVKFIEIDLSDPFKKEVFKENGIDDVVFEITFNKGEPLKPLYKVASGGEASRIMLAFKTYFAKNSTISLMVFDEIDTGVSGTTAMKIADKMHTISQNTQVLCITHLPQVAARGDHHNHIYKLEEKGRTKTEIKKLVGEDRVYEIARMLSGDTLSLYALEHARELIK